MDVTTPETPVTSAPVSTTPAKEAGGPAQSQNSSAPPSSGSGLAHLDEDGEVVLGDSAPDYNPADSEAPPKEESKKEINTSQVDNGLYERALDLGFSKEELQDFETPMQLERALDLFERRLLAPFRNTQQSTQQSIQQQPVQIQQQATVKSEEKTPELEEIPDLPANAEGEEWDPNLKKGWSSMRNTVGALKGIIGKLTEQLTAMKSQHDLLLGVETSRQRQEFTQRFDKMLEGLGPEYEEFVGKGTIDKLDAKSPAFEMRGKILDEMDALAQVYANRSKETGRVMPKEKDIFDRAIRSLLWDKIRLIERKALTGAVSKRARSHSIVPGARQGGENRTPDQRAFEAVKEKLKGWGQDAIEEFDDEFK